ncbi:MAG TPA: hypothetical protein VFJ06_12450 [Halococcus sp.]|nr:hypothetical protein [Halococcus sp.]
MASRQRCKIDRALRNYDLDAVVTSHETVDDYLLARWKGTDGRSAVGYRPLTEWFNKRLLKYTYDETGRDATGTRLESEYEALTGDDELLREEVADDLRMDGVAVDTVLDAMVSWSTMRHHLKRCLEGEKQQPESTSEWERRSVDIARHQTEEKVTDALSSLDSKGRLPGGSATDVHVQVQLQCPVCHVRVPFEEALSRGHICREHLPSEKADETNE